MLARFKRRIMNSRPFQNEEKKATRLHEQIKQLNKENETETDSKKKRVRSDEISSLIAVSYTHLTLPTTPYV